MPRVSTTNLRELSMQISRLLDQFQASGESFAPITNALEGVLTAVDQHIEQIERPRPTPTPPTLP